MIQNMKILIIVIQLQLPTNNVFHIGFQSICLEAHDLNKT